MLSLLKKKHVRLEEEYQDYKREIDRRRFQYDIDFLFLDPKLYPSQKYGHNFSAPRASQKMDTIAALAGNLLGGHQNTELTARW